MAKYTHKTIEKAKKLYNKGVSLRAIMAETGIKSTSTIQFHCDPEYRERMIESGRKWRRENPERWVEICKKAAAKAKRKNGKK
jgi:hypothetical protein